MLLSMFILIRYGLAIQNTDLRLKENSEIELHFNLLSLPSFVISSELLWLNKCHYFSPGNINGNIDASLIMLFKILRFIKTT